MKIRLPVSFMLLISLFEGTYVQAQRDTLHVKEFGIGLSTFNAFNIAYQWGTPNTLYRFSAASISFSNPTTVNTDTNTSPFSQTTTTKTPSVNFSLSFAMLKAKNITGKFDFITGLMIGSSVNYSHTTYSQVTTNISGTSSTSHSSTTYGTTPFFAIPIGARYAINSSFFIYAEIDPRAYYSYSTTTSSQSSSFPNGNRSTTNSYGISNVANTGASLAIVYRFSSKQYKK